MQDSAKARYLLSPGGDQWESTSFGESLHKVLSNIAKVFRRNLFGTRLPNCNISCNLIIWRAGTKQRQKLKLRPTDNNDYADGIKKIAGKNLRYKKLVLQSKNYNL